MLDLGGWDKVLIYFLTALYHYALEIQYIQHVSVKAVFNIEQ